MTNQEKAEKVVAILKSFNVCPFCQTKEVEATGPRTQYFCGTTTYDDRPGSEIRSARCVQMEKARVDAEEHFEKMSDAEKKIYFRK